MLGISEVVGHLDLLLANGRVREAEGSPRRKRSAAPGADTSVGAGDDEEEVSNGRGGSCP